MRSNGALSEDGRRGRRSSGAQSVERQWVDRTRGPVAFVLRVFSRTHLGLAAATLGVMAGCHVGESGPPPSAGCPSRSSIRRPVRTPTVRVRRSFVEVWLCPCTRALSKHPRFSFLASATHPGRERAANRNPGDPAASRAQRPIADQRRRAGARQTEVSQRLCAIRGRARCLRASRLPALRPRREREGRRRRRTAAPIRRWAAAARPAVARGADAAAVSDGAPVAPAGRRAAHARPGPRAGARSSAERRPPRPGRRRARQGPAARRRLHRVLAVDGDGQRHPPTKRQRRRFGDAHLVALRRRDDARRPSRTTRTARSPSGPTTPTTSAKRAAWKPRTTDAPSCSCPPCR